MSHCDSKITMLKYCLTTDFFFTCLSIKITQIMELLETESGVCSGGIVILWLNPADHY